MADAGDVLSKEELREFRNKVARAHRQIKKETEREPSEIIVIAESSSTADSSLDEVVKWLFHRRQNDGNERG